MTRMISNATLHQTLKKESERVKKIVEEHDESQKRIEEVDKLEKQLKDLYDEIYAFYADPNVTYKGD